MANLSDIDHRPGQRGPSPLLSQERIQTEQLVNVGEQALPSTVIHDPVDSIYQTITSLLLQYGLTNWPVGDELGFIMNIGFDAPSFDFMDAFQNSTDTQDPT